MAKFSLGLHYWPKAKGLDFWKTFDPAEIAGEFAQINGLKADFVQIPLIWEDFQPHIGTISSLALRHLDSVFDAAREVGLKVLPVLFSGHECGVNWLPYWLLSDDEDEDEPYPRRMSVGIASRCKVRDLYRDPELLEAQVNLVREIVPRYRQHPALFGWTLSSDLGRVREPDDRRHLFLWNALLAGEVKRLDPKHSALFGMSADDLLRDRIRPEDVAEPEDLLGLGCREMGPEPAEIVFVSGLAAHLSFRRVLVTGVGKPMAPQGAQTRFEDYHEGPVHRTAYFLSEEQAAEYLTSSLTALWQAGAAGAVVYCYADADPSLYSRPPFDQSLIERTFGLVRADGSEKPAAQAFRAFGKKKRKLLAPLQIGFEDLLASEYYEAPDQHFRSRLSEFAG